MPDTTAWDHLHIEQEFFASGLSEADRKQLVRGYKMDPRLPLLRVKSRNKTRRSSLPLQRRRRMYCTNRVHCSGTSPDLWSTASIDVHMHSPNYASWTSPAVSPGHLSSGNHSTMQLSTYSPLLLELRETPTSCCQQQHLWWRGRGRRWWYKQCILGTHCLSNRTSSRLASCGQMWRGLMQDSLISPCSSQTGGTIPGHRRFAIQQANSRRQLEQGSELAC